MATIFEKIIRGEIPCHKIAENEIGFAFLDVNPVQAGHTLVVPKQVVDYYFDLNDELMIKLHLFAKKISHAIKQVTQCKRVGMAVIGLEVPHVHLHLIPMNQLTDLDFRKRVAVSAEQMTTLAEDIRRAYEVGKA